VLVPAIILAMFGSELGVIEARYPPMKIAAAEAQWTTCQRDPVDLHRAVPAGASCTRG